MIVFDFFFLDLKIQNENINLTEISDHSFFSGPVLLELFFFLLTYFKSVLNFFLMPNPSELYMAKNVLTDPYTKIIVWLDMRPKLKVHFLTTLKILFHYLLA